MLNLPAVMLVITTALGIFALSLILARRDTLDELCSVFDLGIVRRALRSTRRFSIGTVIWLIAFVAVMLLVIFLIGDSPEIYLVIPLLMIAFPLARVALLTLTEPGPRRFQPPRRFGDAEQVVTSEQASAKTPSMDQDAFAQTNQSHRN